MNTTEALRLFDDKLFGADTDITKRNIASLLSKYWETEREKDEVLAKVFRSQTSNPTENNDPHQVLIKVTLLNSFYSTFLNNNIVDDDKKPPKKTPPIDIVSMSKLIVKLANEENLDELISEGNLEAVEHIRNTRNFEENANYRDAYSFATKYCSWHQPDKYPIVDSQSKDMVYYLMRYIKQKCEPSSVDIPKRDDLEDYSKFCGYYEIIKDYFHERTGINYSYKDLDKIFWQFGKSRLNSKNPEE